MKTNEELVKELEKTIEKATAEVEYLREQIEKDKAKAKAVHPRDKGKRLSFIPQVGEQYYYWNEICGEAQPLSRYKTCLERKFQINPVFRTKEDCEYHEKMRKLGLEYKSLGLNPWGIEWEKHKGSRTAHYNVYNRYQDSINQVESYQWEANNTYFMSEGDAKRAALLFGNDQDFIYCLREGLI